MAASSPSPAMLVSPGAAEPRATWRQLRNEATEPGRRSSEGIPSSFLAALPPVAANPGSANARTPKLTPLRPKL